MLHKTLRQRGCIRWFKPEHWVIILICSQKLLYFTKAPCTQGILCEGRHGSSVDSCIECNSGTLRAGGHGGVEDGGVGRDIVRGHAVEQLQRQLPVPAPLGRIDEARVRDGIAPVALADLHGTFL